MAEQTKSEIEFIVWLKAHNMYNEWASTATMQNLHRIYEKLEPALTMLEEVLGFTEPLKDYLDPDDFARFKEICAETADLRDGDKV